MFQLQGDVTVEILSNNSWGEIAISKKYKRGILFDC